MRQKKIIAMLLAGGQGSRLGVLTRDTAKPAVPFGGKYRIIDFPLSNCVNSDIDTVGVLTQYRPLELNKYIGTGQPWDLDRNYGGVFVLPPYSTGETGEWYLGTANAIAQNIGFIEQYNPKYVCILSGDHIYKMDYSNMLREHENKNADATIAVLTVPIKEASRFGIMNCDEDGRIFEFEEKPKNPKSNKASMGIYIFTWQVLKRYLEADNSSEETSHDFGKDIIPNMIANGQRLYEYSFEGYWKDVGTIESLWESNMDLLEENPKLNLNDRSWTIYSRNPIMPPHYFSKGATVSRSMITEGSQIYGSVSHSVIFAGVKIGKGAIVVDSVLMPHTIVEENATIFKAIIGENAVIGANSTIGEIEQGNVQNSGITVLGEKTIVPQSTHIPKGAMVDRTNKF